MKRGHGGVMLRVNFDKPNQRMVALDGHIVWIYVRRPTSAEQYDVIQIHIEEHGGAASAVEFRRGLRRGAEEELHGDGRRDGEDRFDRDHARGAGAEIGRRCGKRSCASRCGFPKGKSYAMKERVDKPGKDYVAYIVFERESEAPVPDSDGDAEAAA